MNVYTYPAIFPEAGGERVTVLKEEYEELKRKAAAFDALVTGNKNNNALPTMARMKRVYEATRDYVCEFFRLRVDELEGKERYLYLNHPRHVLIYLCVHFGCTTVYLGQRLGRDHSTISVARKSIAEKIGIYEADRLLVEGMVAVLSVKVNKIK